MIGTGFGLLVLAIYLFGVLLLCQGIYYIYKIGKAGTDEWLN